MKNAHSRTSNAVGDDDYERAKKWSHRKGTNKDDIGDGDKHKDKA